MLYAFAALPKRVGQVASRRSIKMRWKTRAQTDVQIRWANFKATNIGFNIAVKRKFFYDYLLHLTGIRPADLADVNLNNYVAMYYQRRATMNDERLGTGRNVLSDT